MTRPMRQASRTSRGPAVPVTSLQEHAGQRAACPWRWWAGPSVKLRTVAASLLLLRQPRFGAAAQQGAARPVRIGGEEARRSG